MRIYFRTVEPRQRTLKDVVGDVSKAAAAAKKKRIINIQHTMDTNKTHHELVGKSHENLRVGSFV